MMEPDLESHILANQINVGEWVAKGFFGDVYQAQWSQGKCNNVTLPHCPHELKELEVLNSLKGQTFPHLTHFCGCTTIKEKFYLVFDFIQGDKLSKYFYSHKQSKVNQLSPPTNQILTDIFIHIASALNFLHHKNIAHLDVCPENILVHLSHDKPSGILIDLGHSDFFDQQKTMKPWNKFYGAPELWKITSPFDKTADIFSYGMILWEIFLSKIPPVQYIGTEVPIPSPEVGKSEWRSNLDHGYRPYVQKYDIKKVHDPEKIFCCKVFEIVSRCWNQDPKNRNMNMSKIIELLSCISDEWSLFESLLGCKAIEDTQNQMKSFRAKAAETDDPYD